MGVRESGRAERRAGTRILGRFGMAKVKFYRMKKEKETLHGGNCTSFFFFLGVGSGDAEIDVDAIVRTAKMEMGDAARKYCRGLKLNRSPLNCH